MNPITTPLADQILDLIRVAAGPVTLTRIREVVGPNISQADVLITLEAMVEHNVLQAESLPGNRRTYRIALDSISVPTGTVPRPASPAPAPAPQRTVGVAQILTHLAGIDSANCNDIAAATGGAPKRISATLTKQQQLGRVQGIDGSAPRQYRITKAGRDILKPIPAKRWAETRPKPKTPPKAADAPEPAPATAPPPPKAAAPEADRYARVMARLDELTTRLAQPAIALADTPLKCAVLNKLASQAHPEIAEVLDGIADDLRRIYQAATPSVNPHQERRP